MKTLLIHLQPWRKATALRQNVYVGDGPSADGYGLGGTDWEPAVTTRPVLSMETMALDLDGKVQTGRARFTLQLGSIQNVSDIRTLDWQGAPLIIYSADDLAWDRRVVEFTGNIGTARFDSDTNLLTIDAETSVKLIEKPLLTLSFSGGGGINGDAAKRGVLRPAGFGIKEGIEPVWFDETYNIGQIDGYGNLVSVQKLMEGANSWGAAVSNYASYNDLKNAIIAKTIPPGRWGTCIAEGLIGLGAPASKPIQVNATFGYGKPGSFMQRIVEFHAGVVIGSIDTASFTAITTQLETIFGAAANVGLWFSNQIEVKAALEAMASSCNATPLVTFQGMVTVTRGVPSASVGTLDRSGSVEPRVINWKSADSIAPFYQLKARNNRPARVLSRDEVLALDNISDTGAPWNALTGYRYGNTVYGPDGAEWLFISATPQVGPALPTATYPPAALASNANWQQLTRPVPTTGSMIGVADGATNDLKLTSIGSQAVTIAGNSFSRNAGNADYNACVRSIPLQGPQYAEAEIVATATVMVALDDDATSTTLASQLIQIQFNGATGGWAIYSNNVSLFSGSMGAGITGKIRLSYDGVRYRAYVNSTQIGSDIAASASNLILWPKWHAYNGPSIVHLGAISGPYTSNVWPDIGGTGVPASNAVATFILIPLNSNVRATGNELLAVTTTASSAYAGTPATGSAELAWKADAASNHNFMCGFVLAANVANTTMATIAYGLEVSAGTLYLDFGGVQTSLGAAVAGDRYRITYDGVNFRAYRNGTELAAALKTAAVGSTYFGRLGLSSTANVKLTEIAFGSFTQNNFAEHGGATKPSDNATADLVLVSIGSQAVTIRGNAFSRDAGNADYNACVRDAARSGPQIIEVDIAAGSTATILSLDDDATSFAQASMLVFFIYTASSGAWAVIQNGSTLYSGTTTTGLVGKLRLTYDGVHYRCFINQTIMGSPVPASAAGLTLYPKWHAYHGPAINFTGLRAGSFADNDWASTGGPLRPADNAGTTVSILPVGSNIQVRGNSVRRSSGDADWAANFNIAEPLQSGCALMWTVSAVNTLRYMMGLNDVRFGGGDTYTAGDYMVFVYESGVHFYENGSGVSISGTPLAIGEQVHMVYDNVNLRIYRIGTTGTVTLMHTVAAGSQRRFCAVGGVYHFTAEGLFPATAIRFEPATNNYLNDMAGRLTDHRNIPNISTLNLGYKYTGAITYTAAAGTPATATISAAAGSTVAGDVSTSYNAMGANVTGTNGTTVTYYLYVSDPANAGGAQTLVATTTALAVYQANGRIYIGFCDVSFPAAGAGGGGGSGGGGYCVWDEAFVDTARGPVHPDALLPGDALLVLRDDGEGVTWESMERIEFSHEDCFTITAANGFEVTVSATTPITLRDGTIIPVAALEGHHLPVMAGRLRWIPCTARRVGVRRVAKIYVNQKTYAAGDVAGRSILTHNPKP